MCIMFVRRLGPSPTNAEPCAGCQSCPDIIEMDNGDFAVIGTDISEYATQLPAWAGCAPNERMVRIPRRTLILARKDIPETL
jgi:hypothetical protein